jgi:WD40 repeat protein
VWDGENGSLLATLEGHERPVAAVAAPTLRDGRQRIATGSGDSSIIIWVSVDGCGRGGGCGAGPDVQRGGDRRPFRSSCWRS